MWLAASVFVIGFIILSLSSLFLLVVTISKSSYEKENEFYRSRNKYDYDNVFIEDKPKRKNGNVLRQDRNGDWYYENTY